MYVGWSTKKLSMWKSAIYHSIKLPFDVEVAEKFLNGIYYWYSIFRKEEKSVHTIAVCLITSFTKTKNCQSKTFEIKEFYAS